MQQQQENRNAATVEFLNAADERCRAIALLHPADQDIAIKRIADETGLSLRLLTTIIEKYAYLRDGTDMSSLAAQFVDKIGRDKVRAMLLTGFGQRDLAAAAQNFLIDQRLSVTGPRLGLLMNAIKSQFQQR